MAPPLRTGKHAYHRHTLNKSGVPVVEYRCLDCGKVATLDKPYTGSTLHLDEVLPSGAATPCDAWRIQQRDQAATPVATLPKRARTLDRIERELWGAWKRSTADGAVGDLAVLELLLRVTTTPRSPEE